LIKVSKVVVVVVVVDHSLQRSTTEKHAADEIARKLGLQLAERDVKR